MARRNKRIVRYKSPINLNAGIIIFGLISIYLLINIVVYFTTDRTSYFEVVQGSANKESNTTYKGIALRKEKIAISDKTGYIDYYVRENSRVSKSTTLYSIDDTGKLNDLLYETSKENSELTESNINTISDLLYNFSNNYDDMSFNQVYDFKTVIKGTVVDLINMNSLEKIAKDAGDTFEISKSKYAGIVSYRVDGYENLKPRKLKADYFDTTNYVDAKFSSGDMIDASSPIYKVLTSEEWSIAIQLSKEDTKKYKKLNGVKIKFLKDNLTTTANIKVVKGEDGNKYGILTLPKYMIRYASDRYLDIQIVNDPVVGLKIPKSALVTKSLYTIPKNYGFESGINEDVGFNKRTVSEGEMKNEFYYPTITYSNSKNYFVSTTQFKQGDVLIASDSSKEYTIGRTQDFLGVYNINNGYTVFIRIKILDELDDYYIVESESHYGLQVYDRIVLDGSSVEENQIIFQ